MECHARTSLNLDGSFMAHLSHYFDETCDEIIVLYIFVCLVKTTSLWKAPFSLAEAESYSSPLHDLPP